MRSILALVAAAGMAAVSALLLGEYQMTLLTGIAAGIGVGLVVSETNLVIGRRRGLVPVLAVAVLAGGAILWAAWIDSGEGLEPIRNTAWVGVGLAALTAGVRLRPVRG